MTAKMLAPTILAIALVAILAMAGLWDIYAKARGDGFASVSSVISSWGKQFPIFAVAIGVLIGHLFWPPDNK